MKKNQHKGQVALVLVLVMTVASALAVSMASRSTVDTRIQQTETQSVQALLNAQTGVEQLILSEGSLAEGTGYRAERTDVGNTGFDIGRLDSGSSVEINLEGANFGSLTNFKVYWKPDIGNPSGQPAVFISTIKDTGVVLDYAFSYDGQNGFTTAAGTTDYGYSKVTSPIPLTTGTSKIRITTLGSAALMRVVPIGASAQFPSQAKSIKSVGSVNTEDKQVKYGLQYNESLKDTVPAVFDYALFSGGTIVQ